MVQFAKIRMSHNDTRACSAPIESGDSRGAKDRRSVWRLNRNEGTMVPSRASFVPRSQRDGTAA
jgi:hypothetical protein